MKYLISFYDLRNTNHIIWALNGGGYTYIYSDQQWLQKKIPISLILFDLSK